MMADYETMGQVLGTVELLQERLAELELALEDKDYWRLSSQLETEFSREGLRQINRLARLFYLKNPLIRRGVEVQAFYVFGQGMTIRAKADPVNQVVQKFLDDSKNRAELTSHESRLAKEVELALFGDLFFVFFVNPAMGRVRVRTIPAEEIDEIICNPEDRKEPWFYKRIWSEQGLNMTTGQTGTTQRTAYYPNWRYLPEGVRVATIGGQPVEWKTPIYHVKTGGLPDMRFGVSEVYAALDWAKAYKAFLEDWATIVRAYSRFAWNLTVKGGKAGIAAAKAKLNTTYGNETTSQETNPPPLTGSTFIAGEGNALQPIRTAGATTSAEDGRRLLLMVAAATGLPESFFGDISVGTLATAKSLDRPTELKMRSRQTLWADVHRDILAFAIQWAVRAPGGPLQGTVTAEDDGTPVVQLEDDPETGEPMDATVDVIFPPILEHDVDATIKATVSAATLDGKQPAGTMDDETLTRLLLSALGVEDIDAVLDKLAEEEKAAEEEEKAAEEERAARAKELAAQQPPPNAQPAPTPNASPGVPAEGSVPTAEAMMVEAVRELRGAIRAIIGGAGAGPDQAG